jgi:hypothetical protein
MTSVMKRVKDWPNWKTNKITGGKLMSEKNYMLEITMELRSYYPREHLYIKRSFPVREGKLDIGKYDRPYSMYNSVELFEVSGCRNSATGKDDIKLDLKFDGEDVVVWLNSFTTVKRGDQTHIDAYLKMPVTTPLVNTTFYLYIE